MAKLVTGDMDTPTGLETAIEYLAITRQMCDELIGKLHTAETLADVQAIDQICMSARDQLMIASNRLFKYLQMHS